MAAPELVYDVISHIWSFQTDMMICLDSRSISTAWRDAFPFFFDKVEKSSRLTQRIRFLFGAPECTGFDKQDYERVSLTSFCEWLEQK